MPSIVANEKFKNHFNTLQVYMILMLCLAGPWGKYIHWSTFFLLYRFPTALELHLSAKLANANTLYGAIA